MFLIGYRSRIVVFINWLYSFLTLRKSARLITGEVPKMPGASAVGGLASIHAPEAVLSKAAEMAVKASVAQR